MRKGTDHRPANTRLLEKVDAERCFIDSGSGEAAWIEVIQKMDEVYADLVHYQVEVEAKNSALEEAQRFIESVQQSMTDVVDRLRYQRRHPAGQSGA